MLTLTENASMIVKTITEQPESADANGLRISSETDQEAAFAISTAAQPEEQDQVVEQDGATVYLDPTAAQMLEDKVLDAGVDETGNVQFALGQQG
ncbi:Fe-S cluster assembly protein HesB [Nocardioides sp.]|uniref:Fe-S cluster assembly protein HesB n=1 Tax=Nocardioides sp. TaxID=35761 RepID=UPI0027376A92|nr:Fe-S cluster assembly protein HesB [Nocardioides sp.]MDP3894164.1 Fe-S cluster assembly protein HesB [Nocardioides sp.]